MLSSLWCVSVCVCGGGGGGGRAVEQKVERW